MTIFRTGHLGLLLELHWLLVSPVSPLLSMRGHNQFLYYSFRGLGKRDVISGVAVGGSYLLPWLPGELCRLPSGMDCQRLTFDCRVFVTVVVQ